MKTRIWRIAALGLIAVSGWASAQTVINPSFESLGQAGWTAVFDASGCAVWVDNGGSPPTTDGANGVVSNQVCASSQILYQDVTLPGSGLYKFRMDAGCVVNGATANDFCRVDITDTSASTIAVPVAGTATLANTNGGVIANLLETDGSTGTLGQTTRAAIITGAAGQVVRIRFMAVAITGNQNLLLDNVVFAAVAGVPTMSEWALMLMAALLIVAAGFQLRRR